MTEAPERIYFLSNSVRHFDERMSDSQVAYVRADIADRHKAQRDRLLEAAKAVADIPLHLQPLDARAALHAAIAECEGGEE